MTTIIDLIKNKNINELIKVIKNNKNIDLNVRDENYNYFINYVLLYNQEDLIDLVLSRKIRLDILDSDGRNILYIPIKYSYHNILKKLLDKDFNNVGISILDIKDKLGLTALHYSIIFNNYKAFELLLEKGANYLSINNQNLNSLHICIQYNRLQFFINLLNRINELNISGNNNESLLQFSILNGTNEFTNLILKKKINLNNQEDKNGLSALHQAIVKNDNHIIIKLLELNANVNQQDFYGNTPLHYAISDNNMNIVELLIKHNPNYNLTNIDGNTVLHEYLMANNTDMEILEILIKNTDLNIQNNFGLTCLNLLIKNHLFNNFSKILSQKELNFYIQDIYGQDNTDALNDDNILEVAIDSFYNQILENKDKLFLDWEKWCSVNLIEKLKELKIKSSDPSEICKEKIREVIIKEKRSIPKYSSLDLKIDNGIFVNTCYYTGVPLDILFGMIYLYKTFKKDKFEIIIDYPLSLNQNLEKYYEKIGIDYPFKLEFSNCEILWSFQKIFFPSYFDHEFYKKMHDDKIKYISIPLGIELYNGSHANILFIDKNKGTIERFEPNGANHPVGLNYNPILLDDILDSKFSEYDLKLIRPKDFLPIIGSFNVYLP